MSEFIKVIKKPEVLNAVQWFKNGDHPEDNCYMIHPDRDSQTKFEPFLSEGRVVRYFRHPDVSGDTKCSTCGQPMHFHGWIENSKDGETVCPGSWIVTIKGEYRVFWSKLFELFFQVVNQ